MTAAMPTDSGPVFTGAGVALLTLFDEGGHLLLDETAELAARLVDMGAAAVLVGGTTGEFWTLRSEERHALTAAVRAAIPQHVPVLENVGAPTAKATLATAADAAASGAQALLCLVPPDTTPAVLLPEVRALVGELPLLAYHFPRAGFTPIALEELQLVDGIKDSSGDADRLVRTPAQLPAGTFTGSPLLLNLAGALGIAGAILATANLEPAAANAALAGDQSAQATLARLHEQITADVPPRVLKQLAAQRFGTPPWTRSPTLKESFAG